MHRPNLTRSLTLLAVAICGSAGTAWAAGKAHEHGALKLDLAIEGNKLTIAMEAPLDNLLGFERAPRTDAERKAAADVLARLRSPDKATPLFVMDPAAGCTLGKVEVQAPVLEPGAKPAAKDEHADLDASYEFTCAKPDELRTLDVGLFDAYKRTQRIDVQVAGPKGQAKVTLKRPASKVQLVR
jgi:hypothetical protein